MMVPGSSFYATPSNIIKHSSGLFLSPLRVNTWTYTVQPSANKGSDLTLNPANPIWKGFHIPSPVSHQPLLPSPFPLFYYIHKPLCKGEKGSHNTNELLFPDSVYQGCQAIVLCIAIRKIQLFFLAVGSSVGTDIHSDFRNCLLFM